MRLIATALLLLSFSALADATFVGKQRGRNTDCFLYVKQTYFAGNVEDPANFRADVLVEFRDYSHGGGRSEELDFTVAPGARADLLTGTGLNGRDTINLFVNPGTRGLSSPKDYAVRFIHGSHFDSVQCFNLIAR
ncbi:MAG: hypothetical protein ACLGG7_02935 [Bacteriovoracia bacterium]